MKIALVGVGKIALDQHVPAIAESMEWELAATVSLEGEVEGVPCYRDLGAFLEERPDVRRCRFAPRRQRGSPALLQRCRPGGM